jgi:hypothetical protein
MGSVGALFALFVTGYLLGVWTACLVLRQGQSGYEEGSPSTPVRLFDPSVRDERK